MKNILPFIKQHSTLLSFGLLHAFFAGLGQTFLIALFVPLLQDSFQMGSTEFGLYYSLATLLNALTLSWIGAWIDRWPLSRYTLFSSFLLLLALVGGALSSSAWTFFPFLVLLRLGGQGLFTHINATLSARYFSKNRGKALSITTLGHPLGEAVLVPILAWYLSSHNYQEGLWAITLTFVILYYPLWFILHKKAAPNNTSLANKENNDTQNIAKKNEEGNFAENGFSSDKLRRRLLKRPLFWLLLPTMVLPPFMLTGLFLHQAHISISQGWESYWLAQSFTVFALSRIGGSLLGGFLTDRWQARTIFPWYLLPLAVGIILLLITQEKWIAFPYLAGSGLSIGMGSTVKSAAMAEFFGTRILGTVRSLYATAVAIATAISPVLFGWWIDQGVFFGAMSVVSILLVLWSLILAKSLQGIDTPER
jgi:sugar phosphate permease